MANNNYYDDATAGGWSLNGTGWNTMSSAILAAYSVSTNTTGSGTFVRDTAPTITGLSMNTSNITGIKQACFNSIIDDGNSSTADTIDWSTGSIHKSTLTGNCTYTFAAPTGVSRLTLQVIQGAGPYTVTWPASVKWTGATAPTLGTTNGRSDFITFIWDGTNYWGVASTNFN